ncbi:hypothetical protein MCC10100_1909 [Bifidobacterium longum subsp. longum]|uniref:Uncharacterized protein n=1 Tax=Bifidobacterium longum subsp. longum TaxID=1679 RepID=A0A4R0UM00_BIFLL|nr:hypothetical protein MCC10100_1909 [Bifidobacterium longum subsp. longum]
MNLPGGNDGNPPGRTELTPIRLRACCNAYAIHRTPFGRVAPTAWHCCVPHAMLRPANPHIICVAYCHIMRFAIYVTVSDVLVTTSIDLCVYRARFRCPGSPFRLFLSNRDRNTLEKSPIRPYRTISAITHRRNSGLLDLHTLSAHGMVCPGSQKEAKITNRDNEIWPGSHVNRLPSPPGHRLRIDKMLQCLTGMRPYRDSNVSLEVEESSSTPPNRKHGGILQCSESPRPVLGVADHGFERRGCSWTAA